MALTRAEIAKILLFGNPKKYTWATKPSAASVPANRSIFITDVGGWNGTTHSGSFWFSNGTLWRPVSGVLMLASSVTHTDSAPSVVEQTMYSYTLQGGVMAVGDSLRVTAKYNYSGTTGVTTRNRYGGQEFSGNPGVTYGLGITQHVLNNRATSTQVASILSAVASPSSLNSGLGSTQISTISVDSSTDLAIALTMQKTTAGDSMSLDSVLIELLAG